MNEIVRTFMVGLEMYLPHRESLALIQKVAGTYKGVPFYIQPFTGNA
ncbi:MAG: hypothetical protein HZA19_05240 [Nitrospirae bacterium]|nr:hypothetical protein [Nitrospirota bacterium]